MSFESYTDPVAQLLLQGDIEESRDPADWVDYVTTFGLTEEHVPELLQLASDLEVYEVEEDDPAGFANLHAVRALGQVGSETAIAPMIELCEREDDFLRENLHAALAIFGARAIAPLKAVVYTEEKSIWIKISCIDVLETIAKKNPETLSEISAILIDQLEKYETNEEALDSMLVDLLAELQVTEAAPLIETVFAHKELDEFITGSWAQVQVRLGVRKESEFSKEELTPRIPEHVHRIREMIELLERQQPKSKGFGNVAQTQPAKKSKKKKKKR